MIGIFVILGISWLLLHFLEERNLMALGWLPIGLRSKQFIVGFLFLAAIHVLFIYTEAGLKSTQWVMNPSFSVASVSTSLWYHTKSALTEELIFRGALLYTFISKIGRRKALFLSAVAFGVYHWFTFNVLGGGLVPMIFVFLVTGFMGYAWAYAFAQTKSIMLPLGLHIGWNFVATLFTPTQPYGELIFKAVSTEALSNAYNFLLSLGKGLLPPLFVILLVRYWIGQERGNEEPTEEKTIVNH